MVGLTPK
jgi:hypothetical protein